MTEAIFLLVLGVVSYFVFLWGLEVRINRHNVNLIDALLSLCFMLFGLIGLLISFTYLVVH